MTVLLRGWRRFLVYYRYQVVYRLCVRDVWALFLSRVRGRRGQGGGRVRGSRALRSGTPEDAGGRGGGGFIVFVCELSLLVSNTFCAGKHDFRRT